MELYHAEQEKRLTTKGTRIHHKDHEGKPMDYTDLRTGHDVVGRGGEFEGHAALLIEPDGFG
jgi:hypothetical protein